MNLKHGHTGRGRRSSPTWLTWFALRQRCRIKDGYFDRGIKVCDRWKHFGNFLEDMGERPEGMFIDRIDNDGDYEPSNCRWATTREQSNNRRSNHFIKFKGETKTLKQWADKFGLSSELLSWRIKRWPLEEALTKVKRT